MHEPYSFEPLFSFTVTGDPVAQPRARHDRSGTVRSNSDASLRFKRQVAWSTSAAGRGKVGDERTPFEVVIEAVFNRPRSHRAPLGTVRGAAPWAMTSKPDGDNVAKAVLDGMSKSERCPWHDDAQVVRVTLAKRWADLGEDPGVRVAVARASK